MCVVSVSRHVCERETLAKVELEFIFHKAHLLALYSSFDPPTHTG